MTSAVIQVEKIGKRFRMGERGHHSLRDMIAGAFKGPFEKRGKRDSGLVSSELRRLRPGGFIFTSRDSFLTGNYFGDLFKWFLSRSRDLLQLDHEPTAHLVENKKWWHIAGRRRNEGNRCLAAPCFPGHRPPPRLPHARCRVRKIRIGVVASVSSFGTPRSRL